METKHQILYPGMDYEKCSICGYIATEYTVESLENQIKKKEFNAQINKKESETLKDLRLLLNKSKKQRNLHCKFN